MGRLAHSTLMRLSPSCSRSLVKVGTDSLLKGLEEACSDSGASRATLVVVCTGLFHTGGVKSESGGICGHGCGVTYMYARSRN